MNVRLYINSNKRTLILAQSCLSYICCYSGDVNLDVPVTICKVLNSDAWWDVWLIFHFFKEAMIYFVFHPVFIVMHNAKLHPCVKEKEDYWLIFYLDRSILKDSSKKIKVF